LNARVNGYVPPEDFYASAANDAASAPDEKTVKNGTTEKPKVTPIPHVGPNVIFAPQGPIPWVCQGLRIAKGGAILLAGYGFSGKTMIAQDIALSMASGRPAFGVHEIVQGRVLHLDYEQGSYLTMERYQRLARGRGISLADVGDRLCYAEFPKTKLDSPNALDVLVQTMEGFDLVIVDSLRAAAPDMEENSSAARGPIDLLVEASGATSTRPVPLVIDHARKPSDTNRGGAEMSIRGSGAKFDASTGVFVLFGDDEENEDNAERGPTLVKHRKERWRGKRLAEFGIRIVDVEIDGVADAGLRVEYLDNAALKELDREDQADALDAAKKRVTAFLKNKPGNTFVGTREEFGKAVGMKAAARVAALQALEGEGVVRIVAGTKALPGMRIVLVEECEHG
jgi:AAA domain